MEVPDISEGENFDRFVDGLKHNVRLEVLKSTVATSEDATKIALRVDSALWTEYQSGRNGYSPFVGQQGSASDSTDPTPMELGNVDGRNRRPLTANEKEQRYKNKQNDACFVCHTPKCRPYKCRQPKINNTEMQESTNDPPDEEPAVSDSDSEK